MSCCGIRSKENPLGPPSKGEGNVYQDKSTPYVVFCCCVCGEFFVPLQVESVARKIRVGESRLGVWRGVSREYSGNWAENIVDSRAV